VRPWVDLRDRLVTVAALESHALRRVGLPPIAVYVAAAVLGVIFGIVRVAPAVTELWYPFYTYLYTESMPLLAVAMAAGLMGRTVGLAFFIPFVIADALVFHFLGAGGGQSVPHSPGAYLGRVLGFVLLAMLMFTFPAIARMFLAVVRRRGVPFIVLGAAAGAAAFGLLVLAWTIAVPYLIRPIFNNDFVPPLSISELQYFGEILALIAAGLALVAGLVLQPRANVILDAVALAPWGRWIDRLGLLRWPLAAIGVVFFFMGLITTWVDVAILVVGVALGPLLAPLLARTAPFRWLFGHVPLVLRLLIGVAVASLLAAAVRRLYFEPAFGSEFFPFVLTVALGIPIVRWLVGPTGTAPASAPPAPADRAAGTTTTVATIAVLLILGMVIFASPVYADNCSGRVDCAVGKLSEWAAAALAFMAALLAGLWTGLKNAVIHPLIPEGLASEEATEAIRGGVDWARKAIADDAAISDPEEAYRIRNLSPKDFLQEAATGKWDGIIGAGERAASAG